MNFLSQDSFWLFDLSLLSLYRTHQTHANLVPTFWWCFGPESSIDSLSSFLLKWLLKQHITIKVAWFIADQGSFHEFHYVPKKSHKSIKTRLLLQVSFRSLDSDFTIFYGNMLIYFYTKSKINWSIQSTQKIAPRLTVEASFCYWFVFPC